MRNQTIRRFWATYLLDLRLTCFHWSYLLFVMLWSGFIIYTYVSNNYYHLELMFNFVLGFIGLIGMFLTGIQASRAQRNRFDLLEIALPGGVEVLLARWLAIITAVDVLLIAPLVVVAMTSANRVDSVLVVHNLLLCLLSTAFTTGLIWLAQNTMRIRRWMYPLFGVFWLSGGVLPNLLSNNGLPVPGINLVNFITLNQPLYSVIWRDNPQGQLHTLTVLFYVGVVALLVGVMLWRVTVTRFYRRSLVTAALIVAALCDIVFAGASYTMHVYAANQQVLDEDQTLQKRLDQLVQPAEMPFEVKAYNVTFALDTPTRLSAQMEITNRSDGPLTELVFSLYHQFEVTEASVPHTRDRDILTLSLPEPLAAGASTQINVTYQGNISYLERQRGRPPEATYFIHPEGVYLTCEVLWYPVPGRLLPNYIGYDRNYQAIYSCPLDHPASFRLTIEQPGALQYVSNLKQIDSKTFVSAGTTWAQLIGAKALQTNTNGSFTLTTIASQYDRVEALVNQYYSPIFAHVQKFFPEAKHLTVTALDLTNDSFTQWSSYPATQESLVVVISPRQFDFLAADTQSEYYYVGAPLIKSLFDGVENTLSENIAYFLWVHYKTNGNQTQMQPLMENGLPSGGGTSFYSSIPHKERYQIALALYDVYRSQGENALVNLLHRTRTQMNSLSLMTPEQVIAWIKDSSNVK